MSDIKDNVSVCTLCDQHTNDETETKWDCFSDPYCENCFDSFPEETKKRKYTEEELKACKRYLEDQERKFKDCKHPNTKQGCCDFCGKDMIGE